LQFIEVVSYSDSIISFTIPLYQGINLRQPDHMDILTPNDALILCTLFNQDPPLPPAPIPSPSARTPPSPLRLLESAAIAPLSVPSPSRPALHQTITSLSALIIDHPTHASLYNNRAQALRLLHGSDLTIPDAAASGIYDDLCRTIDIATGLRPETQDGVLGKAYSQRGYLLLKTARSLRQGARGGLLPHALVGCSADEMERQAEDDFKAAAGWGDEAARVMVVKMNPVRKLCGEIVREAMVRDMRESGVFAGMEGGR
jgi:hypothetical protein